eukprot:10447086-Lingulodinium_polyedra.AAC.1
MATTSLFASTSKRWSSVSRYARLEPEPGWRRIWSTSPPTISTISGSDRGRDASEYVGLGSSEKFYAK